MTVGWRTAGVAATGGSADLDEQATSRAVAMANDMMRFIGMPLSDKVVLHSWNPTSVLVKRSVVKPRTESIACSINDGG